MQTLRRTVAVLTFAAIAWLGAACERETPTASNAVPPITAATAYGPPTRWVNDNDPNGPPYNPTGGTSCIDPGYQTIQAAVNAASAGEIIMVCDGTYPEVPSGGLLTVANTLTLLGAQNTVDARGARALESAAWQTRALLKR